MRLILVRHGETAWNAQRCYQGRTDVPLNEAGRRQAAALAQRLVREEIHVVCASDLQRAWETARAIAASHGLPLCSEPRLREMSFGDWEGLTYQDIQRRYPQALIDWEADPLNSAPPGGETLAQVAARAESVLDDLFGRHQDRTVLLVTHSGLLRVLLCLVLGLAPEAHWRFRLDIASLSELHLRNENAVLVRLNDTHHLEKQITLESQQLEANRMGQLILVLGGARSGKSTFAQQLAEKMGGERVLYVATAKAGDKEMQQHIEKHQRERPTDWRTLEAQRNVGRAITRHIGDAEVVLMDCLTMLVSNLLMDVEDASTAETKAKVMTEVQGLTTCAERAPGPLIVVSNEVGMGLVPPYPLGRTYRDLLGQANQALAQKADEVYFMVAGIPIPIKRE